ncbi:hypothetical protein BVRB_025930, partial [Beta vulgaris subsp. vulgaris]
IRCTNNEIDLYLVAIDGDTCLMKALKGSGGSKTIQIVGRVLYAYEPKAKSELPLKEGEVIEIFQKDATGWWEGRSMTTGEVGYFPGNYVEEVQDNASLISPSNVKIKLEPLKDEPPVRSAKTLKSHPTNGVKPKTGQSPDLATLNLSLRIDQASKDSNHRRPGMGCGLPI